MSSLLHLSPMSRRMTPLYIAALLQGIPFWYAIEKLFMTSIGFNTASIGLMVVIMSIVMLAVETPSGFLADRWSRKGVMLLGCISLLISGIIGALSFNESVFIISTVFWGVYAALYSGTYDAVIYDTTIEETGNSNMFEHYLGRLRAVEGVSFIIGALSGGLIASIFSMREAFYFTVPFLCLALIFIWKFQEPQLHKAEVNEPVFKHIRQTFEAVLKNHALLPVVVATVGFSVLLDTIFELGQLWFIAVAAPIALYGLFSAAVFSTWTAGGLIASKIKSRVSISLLMGILLSSVFSLIFIRHFWFILAAQFLLTLCLVALGVILAKKLHDELPSRLRAGSSSVVSTMARMILIPLTLLFTTVAHSQNVFDATFILFAVAVIATLSYAFISTTKKIVAY